MQDAISLFIHQRLETIMEDLRCNNAGDCDTLRDYLDQEFVTTAIMQEEVYQQGFLDCIRLLRSLGV